MTDKDGYDWYWCDTCDGAFVKCKHCGNYCCNGGSEINPATGKLCGCVEAYAHQTICWNLNKDPLRSEFPPEDIMLDVVNKLFLNAQ